MKERWKMNRIGFVNFWLYDEEDFEFEDASDTEVVLKSFVKWGAECVDKLNGIFAFVIWDEHEQRLFMARDAHLRPKASFPLC